MQSSFNVVSSDLVVMNALAPTTQEAQPMQALSVIELSTDKFYNACKENLEYYIQIGSDYNHYAAVLDYYHACNRIFFNSCDTKNELMQECFIGLAVIVKHMSILKRSPRDDFAKLIAHLCRNGLDLNLFYKNTDKSLLCVAIEFESWVLIREFYQHDPKINYMIAMECPNKGVQSYAQLITNKLLSLQCSNRDSHNAIYALDFEFDQLVFKNIINNTPIQHINELNLLYIYLLNNGCFRGAFIGSCMAFLK